DRDELSLLLAYAKDLQARRQQVHQLVDQESGQQRRQQVQPEREEQAGAGEQPGGNVVGAVRGRSWHGSTGDGRPQGFRGYPRAFSASPISSRMPGSSMVAGTVYSTPSAMRFTVPLRIFPERVFGRRFTTAAVLKLATGPMPSRTRVI